MPVHGKYYKVSKDSRKKTNVYYYLYGFLKLQLTSDSDIWYFDEI